MSSPARRVTSGTTRFHAYGMWRQISSIALSIHPAKISDLRYNYGLSCQHDHFAATGNLTFYAWGIAWRYFQACNNIGGQFLVTGQHVAFHKLYDYPLPDCPTTRKHRFPEDSPAAFSFLEVPEPQNSWHWSSSSQWTQSMTSRSTPQARDFSSRVPHWLVRIMNFMELISSFLWSERDLLSAWRSPYALCDPWRRHEASKNHLEYFVNSHRSALDLVPICQPRDRVLTY